MDFEEWWWPRKPLGDELISGDVVTTAARAAWGARDAEINELKKANSRLAEAAIVPEGYVLVPVEPTDKMVKEAFNSREDWYRNYDGSPCIQRLYKAMIQAAQEEE